MVVNSPPAPSAISTSIAETGAKTSIEALPQEILHNLRYQHNWTDLLIHEATPESKTSAVQTLESTIAPSLVTTNCTRLISGVPPRHIYIHPDFLNHLVQNNIEETDVKVQREWVVPMSIGEKWSLKKFCELFDKLPTRGSLEGASDFKHQDAKRILCGMKAHDGFGGDGTIVYYIMQEGEVKPRQN